jgi:hypothetical protein
MGYKVISDELGIPPIQIPLAQFLRAQTYVVMLAVGYCIDWVNRLVWLKIG